MKQWMSARSRVADPADLEEIARKYGVAVAEGLFEDMQDPNNRGINFRWINFPEMAFRYAYHQIFMAFSDKDFKLVFKAIAGDAAEARARELLTLAPEDDIIDRSEFGPVLL